MASPYALVISPVFLTSLAWDERLIPLGLGTPAMSFPRYFHLGFASVKNTGRYIHGLGEQGKLVSNILAEVRSSRFHNEI